MFSKVCEAGGCSWRKMRKGRRGERKARKGERKVREGEKKVRTRRKGKWRVCGSSHRE